MSSRVRRISAGLILCMLLFGGCQKQSSKEKEDEIKQPSKQYENIEEQQVHEGDSDFLQLQPPETIEVPIYTIDADTNDIKAVVANVSADTEVDLDVIVQLVVADIADKSYVIKVNETSMDDKMAIIDFSSQAPPVKDCSEETELLILDAIAFSVLDNLPECNQVIYRVDQKAYNSKYQSFGDEQAFISR